MFRFKQAFATVLACAGIVGPTFTDIGTLAVGRQGTPASQVNRDEILASQTKDEKGGSAEAGRPLYDERCAVCHRFGGIGKDVGPDLTTIISRFKKKDILESVCGHPG